MKTYLLITNKQINRAFFREHQFNNNQYKEINFGEPEHWAQLCRQNYELLSSDLHQQDSCSLCQPCIWQMYSVCAIQVNNKYLRRMLVCRLIPTYYCIT